MANLNWGWLSGTALGIGSAIGVATESWIVGIAVTIAIAAFMIWRRRDQFVGEER